jgi:hypothetical protein
VQYLPYLSAVAGIACSSLSQYNCTIFRSSMVFHLTFNYPFHLYTQLLNLNLTTFFEKILIHNITLLPLLHREKDYHQFLRNSPFDIDWLFCN